MPAIETRDIEYVYEGARMLGYFSSPEGGTPGPAVLVIHGGFGITEPIRRRVEGLAASGYPALAADVWGDRRLPASPAEFVPLIKEVSADQNLWMGRLRAAHEVLVAQPEVDGASVVAIGYCFGGSSVLEYARIGADVHGVVSFHGGLDLVSNDWGHAEVRSKVLICTGADDHMASGSDLLLLQSAMSAAGVDWELDVYSGTNHAYTFYDSPNFNAQSDRRSWTALHHFLEEVFGSAEPAS